MNRIVTTLMIPALLLAAALSGCTSVPVARDQGNRVPSPLHDDGDRSFTADVWSLTYSVSNGPSVIEQRFTAEVQVDIAPGIRSYKFENDINGDREIDNVVLLAISGSSAGLAILDGNANPLAEYGKGKVIGHTIIFELVSPEGRRHLRWLIGDRSIGSFIEMYDPDGRVVYTESTLFDIRK